MPAYGQPPLSQAMSACTIASAASTSNSIDLGLKAYERLVVTRAAAFSTGAALTVQGSVDDSTFKNVFTLVPTSSAVQYQQLIIATATSTGFAVIPTPGMRYVRFLASDTIDNGGVITVYGAH